MLRFGCVILVDRRGWLLLQERDEHPAIDPEKWSFCGGHLEEGEEYADGASRELAEETGVQMAPHELELFCELDLRPLGPDRRGAMAVYAAATDLTDDDIVLGEGRQIVFVEPDAARRLDLSPPAAVVLRDFLDSDHYRRLCR